MQDMVAGMGFLGRINCGVTFMTAAIPLLTPFPVDHLDHTEKTMEKIHTLQVPTFCCSSSNNTLNRKKKANASCLHLCVVQCPI